MLRPQAIRDRVKVGSDHEIAHTYAYRSACPSALWKDLLAQSTSELFFCGYTNYFFWTLIPRFSTRLSEKAEQGVRIRFLVGDPEGEVTRARESVEGVALTVSTRIRMTLENLAALRGSVEVRHSAAEDATHHVSLSTFRFDEDALVTPHLARLVGHDSPLLHLRRRGSEGMFERFAENAEELWSRGVPAW